MASTQAYHSEVHKKIYMERTCKIVHPLF